MNEHFRLATSAIPALFAELNESPLLPYGNATIPRHTPGVYAFFRNGVPVHVGRTRDLRNRLQNHITPRHNSASFAFKQARLSLGAKASYTTKGSRADLAKEPIFAAEFLRQIELVRSGQFRYAQVADPVEQYLLELYAHMEYGLPLDEFETH